MKFYIRKHWYSDDTIVYTGFAIIDKSILGIKYKSKLYLVNEGRAQFYYMLASNNDPKKFFMRDDCLNALKKALYNYKLRIKLPAFEYKSEIEEVKIEL